MSCTLNMRVFLFYVEIALKKRIFSLITAPKVAQTKQFDGELYIKLDELSHCPHAKQRYGLYLFPSEAKQQQQ